MPNCPECGALIDLDEDELEEGETLACPECSSELEVVNTHPLELDVIEDEEEELDEEEEEEEEDLFEEEEEEDNHEEEGDNGFH